MQNQKKRNVLFALLMKLLFQFMFSDASMNDANSYYQHISAGYTKLGYTEKIPCNIDIRKDFIECLEWRQEVLRERNSTFFIKVLEIQILTFSLGQMKDFQDRVEHFMKDVEEYREDFCLVYGDVDAEMKP
jgi:hypothetical protein